MKILMLAPEPFFQPRGTPFSEYYRIRCLTEMGHTVDLVTYHIGADVEIPGLRIIRAPKVPGLDDIKIGPSLAKLPLDLFLFFKAWQVLQTEKYDAIHSHEEAGIMAVLFSRMYGLPHVYDMHSSLPDQLDNFKFSNSKFLKLAFDWMERLVLREADAVIGICDSLVDKVREMEENDQITLIENVAESHAMDEVAEEEVTALRRKYQLEGKKVILYIGTFEAYQGLDILLKAYQHLLKDHQDTVLLMVGGSKKQVAEISDMAVTMGLADSCRFTGQVPHDDVPKFLKLADLLTSPRSRGTNTPLKIYSYLRSGKPIVATDLYTHTQVLNSDVAELVNANGQDFAAGMAKILADPEHGKELANNAFALSEDKYSYRSYVEKTESVFSYIQTVIND
jgi:glycosyltransferase involved in cell wall biosynthesis